MSGADVVELTMWLRRRVAYHLDVDADTIDPALGLADQGLDSLYLPSLVTDAEDHLDIEIDYKTIQQHPTIDAMAAHLVGLHPCRRPVPAAGGAGTFDA